MYHLLQRNKVKESQQNQFLREDQPHENLCFYSHDSSLNRDKISDILAYFILYL